jgi:hypothetical protein
MSAQVQSARRLAVILLIACVLFLVIGGLAQSMRVTRLNAGFGVSAANAAPDALFPGQKAAILGVTHLLATQIDYSLFIPVIQN